MLNRAVDVSAKSFRLNPLTDFDKHAINFFTSKQFKEIYGSFISLSSDDEIIRGSISSGVKLIPKIETAKGGTIKKPWCTQKALSPAIIMKANRVMQYYGIKYAFERNPHVPRFKGGQQPWFAEEIKSQGCKSS